MAYRNSDHPALGALSAEQLAVFNSLSLPLQAFFTQQNAVVDGRPQYGAPNDITPAGCLALAKLSNEHGAAQGTVCALWNEWRQAFSQLLFNLHSTNVACFANVDVSGIDFSGFRFGYGADFRGAKADRDCWVPFDGAVFGEGARFDQAQVELISMRNAVFQGPASFCQSRADWLILAGGHFHGDAHFDECAFRVADFERARFEGKVIFCAAQLGSRSGGKTCFRDAYFAGPLNFDGATAWGDLDLSARNSENDQMRRIAQRISFCGTDFHGKADFSNRVFGGSVDFSVLKRDLKVPLWSAWDAVGVGRSTEEYENPRPQIRSGKRTIFANAPIFHGCTLHPDTSFEDAVFPPDQPEFKGEGEAAMRAYRTLKLAFNGLHATREEQRFFRYEMIEESKLLKQAVANAPMRGRLAARGRLITFQLYECLADWGFSLWRPVAFLVLLPLLAAYCIHLEFATHAGESLTAASAWAGAFEYTLLRGLPGFDARASEIGKSLFTHLGAPDRLALTMVGLALKLCLLLGFFLIGLALRNRFKIK